MSRLTLTCQTCSADTSSRLYFGTIPAACSCASASVTHDALCCPSALNVNLELVRMDRSRLKPPPGKVVQTWPLTCPSPSGKPRPSSPAGQDQHRPQPGTGHQIPSQQPQQQYLRSSPSSSPTRNNSSDSSPSVALLGWIWPSRRRSAAVPVLMRSHAGRFVGRFWAGSSTDDGGSKQQRLGAEAFPLLAASPAGGFSPREPSSTGTSAAGDPFMELLMTVTFHVDGKHGKVMP